MAYEKYQYSLLYLCERLHIYTNGSPKSWVNNNIEMYDEIKNRANCWRESWNQNDIAYDALVRALCATTLKDFERIHSKEQRREMRNKATELKSSKEDYPTIPYKEETNTRCPNCNMILTSHSCGLCSYKSHIKE